MEYPHTTISRDLLDLGSFLRARGHDDLVEIVNRLTVEYGQKRAYWTSRIAELEADAPADAPQTSGTQYPHTAIQSNMERLRASLESSGSPERQTRLDLLSEIVREYSLKRAWFTQFK